jgi:uncharacterized membrane protein
MTERRGTGDGQREQPEWPLAYRATPCGPGCLAASFGHRVDFQGFKGEPTRRCIRRIDVITTLETILLLLSLTVLAGYYLWLAYELRRKPQRTVIGYSALKRREWVQSVMADRRDILAVQTLRNWSMAASFLATTTILIATGALHFLTTIPQQPELFHNLNFLGSTSPTMITVKLFSIVAALLVAFLNFAMAIRYYNHVSIEINVPQVEPGDDDLATVQKILDRGSLHYTVGMRCFYLAIPLALWLFGPLWLLLGSILLCIALYPMDRLG